MPRAILGPRIRQRRRSLGITQVDLARRIGISASYLNLIERNKRPVAGLLLRRTAAALGIGLDELDGAAERRLLDALQEIAAAPDFAALGVETHATGELIGRYPGWAQALAALARAENAATTESRALADRLTHDPVLAETVHLILSHIASIRSAVEILTDYHDVPADQREHFLRIIGDESRALSDAGAALSAYFDRAAAGTGRRLSPIDEVEALFEAHDARFEEIEAAAAALAQASPLADRSEASARARAAETLGPLITAIVAREPGIGTPAAAAGAQAALTDYAGAALLAPMPSFAPAAAELRYDIEALADAFRIDATIACQRLAALPDGPRLGYLRVNAAGSLIERRRSLPGLFAPRYAAACPLWVLYRAQQAPETVIRQLARFPNGDRFVFIARAHVVGAPGFGRPRHYRTDMLAMSEPDARHTVYAPDPGLQPEEVGPACRICSRLACAHRVEDTLAG